MRKLFSGSSIIMLVLMIAAVAIINTFATTRPKDDPDGETMMEKHPYVVAMIAGVAAWLIDWFFDKKGRTMVQNFAAKHNEELLA